MSKSDYKINLNDFVSYVLKKSFIIIPIVILIGLFATGGYYLLKHKSAEEYQKIYDEEKAAADGDNVYQQNKKANLLNEVDYLNARITELREYTTNSPYMSIGGDELTETDFDVVLIGKDVAAENEGEEAKAEVLKKATVLKLLSSYISANMDWKSLETILGYGERYIKEVVVFEVDNDSEILKVRILCPDVDKHNLVSEKIKECVNSFHSNTGYANKYEIRIYNEVTIKTSTESIKKDQSNYKKLLESMEQMLEDVQENASKIKDSVSVDSVAVRMHKEKKYMLIICAVGCFLGCFLMVYIMYLVYKKKGYIGSTALLKEFSGYDIIGNLIDCEDVFEELKVIKLRALKKLDKEKKITLAGLDVNISEEVKNQIKKEFKDYDISYVTGLDMELESQKKIAESDAVILVLGTEEMTYKRLKKMEFVVEKLEAKVLGSVIV